MEVDINIYTTSKVLLLLRIINDAHFSFYDFTPQIGILCGKKIEKQLGL